MMPDQTINTGRYPNHELTEKIVGMTNTAGGFLFLDAEDAVTIKGVQKKTKFGEFVANTINESGALLDTMLSMDAETVSNDI